MHRHSTRRKRQAAQFPLATLPYYGADDTVATTLVVSVVDRRSDPLAMRTWTTVGVDVRTDAVIAASVDELLREYGVKRENDDDFSGPAEPIEPYRAPARSGERTLPVR